MLSISRRKFIKIGAMSTLYFSSSSKGFGKIPFVQKNSIRLGGPVFQDFTDPNEWVTAHKKWGYSAAYCPVDANAPEELVMAYKSIAASNNLIIAEVGAWSNPISPDDNQRKKAIDYCCQQLDLADKISANCCVNIAGSRNPEKWDGPHKDNLSKDTFDMIVEVTQKIIDQVKPRNTYFALETMPWIFPNSVESYLDLIKKIDRKRFACHFDPVNLINSPERYYNNGAIIKDAFEKLGKHIKSCHGKDTIILNELTTHINETQPGKGNLNYGVYLKELNNLDNIPLMLEHMEEPEEYRAAGKYLQGVAKENELEICQL